jgi:hypothetical protein
LPATQCYAPVSSSRCSVNVGFLFVALVHPASFAELELTHCCLLTEKTTMTLQIPDISASTCAHTAWHHLMSTRTRLRRLDVCCPMRFSLYRHLGLIPVITPRINRSCAARHEVHSDREIPIPELSAQEQRAPLLPSGLRSPESMPRRLCSALDEWWLTNRDRNSLR